MKTILGGKASGKTTKLIDIISNLKKKEKVVFICANQQEKVRIQNEFKRLDLGGITVASCQENLRLIKSDYTYVDNAEWILSLLLQTSSPIKAITMGLDEDIAILSEKPCHS